METKLITLTQIENEGANGKAFVTDTGEETDFINPGKVIAPIQIGDVVECALMHITAGSPPITKCIAVLKNKPA